MAATPKRMAAMTAARKAFIFVVPDRSPERRRPRREGQPGPSFGGCRARPDLRTARRAGLLLLNPEVVVGARPGKIDLTAAHRVVGALHPERADVDVG